MRHSARAGLVAVMTTTWIERYRQAARGASSSTRIADVDEWLGRVSVTLVESDVGGVVRSTVRVNRAAQYSPPEAVAAVTDLWLAGRTRDALNALADLENYEPWP